MDRTILKSNARAALSPVFWNAILTTLVFTILSGIVSITIKENTVTVAALVFSLISIAFEVFVGYPLAVGYARYCLDIAEGKEARFETLFSGFSKNYGKNVWVTFASILPVFVLAIIYAIVGVFFINLLALTAPVFSGFLFAVLTIAFCIVCIIYSLGISQITFMLADPVICDQTESATDFIKKSWNLMDGRKGEYFILNLSFILWYLLGAITFGIALLYVTPYVEVTCAFYYKELLKNNM